MNTLLLRNNWVDEYGQTHFAGERPPSNETMAGWKLQIPVKLRLNVITGQYYAHPIVSEVNPRINGDN